MYKLNLSEIHDGLEGYWWHRIRTSDFAFQTKIPNQSEAEVEDDDILIHKEYKKDEYGQRERFPTTRYQLISDGEPLEIDGKEVRKQLGGKLAEFVDKHKKLPYACEFKKVQQDDLIIFNYSPNPFETFQLKIEPLALNVSEDESETFIKSLEAINVNILAETGDVTTKISPVTDAAILEQISGESGGKVYVFEGVIIEIDLRKSFFQGSETIFYLLAIKGGQAAPDDKKSTLRRDFPLINAKASENALEKFDLKIGNVISFTGQLKNDKSLKWVIQNIRKFTKA
jgi:hypothetical protein